MKMIDLIEKKRHGGNHSPQEMDFLINGIIAHTIPDYQLSAWLMAVCFVGLTNEETACLTIAMAEKGDQADLSGITGFKVDKHSTGGVGDKTTLVVAPMVAAAGAMQKVKVAKMSGRGLGHTGGTVDKLESIPGFRTAISSEEFKAIVQDVGLAVVGQSGSLAPADKRLYALRDVTATVDSIPLIASSIMSKKLASGADGILLDVKVGSGAFMKTLDEAVTLAELMVSIGTHAGRTTTALITNMDIPLGRYIGNALELKESIALLKGEGEEDLSVLCGCLGVEMLLMADVGSEKGCQQLIKMATTKGTALLKLTQMVEAQGGDGSYITDPIQFPIAPEYVITAKQEGYITHMDSEKIGLTAVRLGAGRATKDEAIDLSAGIFLSKKTGEYVMKGEEIAIFYTNRPEMLEEAKEIYLSALTFGAEKPTLGKLILAKVDRRGVVLY